MSSKSIGSVSTTLSYPGFKDLPVSQAVEYLSKALERAKGILAGQEKLNAAIAQTEVHSLGKGKAVSSNLTRSSKKRKKKSQKWMGPMFDRT